MSETENQPLPRQFGKYVLVRKIAQGGMAEIFKAKTAGAEGFEKEVVIKRILPHFTEDESFVKMFIDEAAITSKLQHANIVQIFDFDVCEGSYYIAMELIEGVDLKKVIDVGLKVGHPLSIAQVVWIMMEISKGLHYAHTKEYKGQPLNIVHRDISPHNAMVSYQGEVKLMDFGIAKAAQRSTKTMAGTVKGKVAYMSPEQARGKPLDGRSDLFALGIMLWEMLTGKRLFLGDSDFETLTNVLKNEAPPPSQLNPKVPKEVDDIVAKALKKDRDQRYENVEAFARDLTRWYYSNVTDLEKESLKNFMQVVFKDEIATLAALSAEERGIHHPAARPATTPAPAPSAPARRESPAPAPAPADASSAPTLLEGQVSQQALMQQIRPGSQPATAAPAPTQHATGSYANLLPPENKSKTWLWILLVLLLGGGGAAAAIIMTSGGGEAPKQPEVPRETGELLLSVEPKEAKITVDGKPAEEKVTGLEVGKKVKVVAEAPGYQRYEAYVTIEKGGTVHKFALEKEREKVNLVIEAGGDNQAIIKVDGKPFGTGQKMYEGFKGDTITVEITPSDGGEAIKREVLLDGRQAVLSIPVGAKDAKLRLKLETAGATVTASKGTVAVAPDGSMAEVSGLKVGESVEVTIEKADHEARKENVLLNAPDVELTIKLAKKAAATPTPTPSPTPTPTPTPAPTPTPTPTPAPTPTAKANGAVAITARPWAQIMVDGRPSGTTPKTVQLPPGSHSITLTNGGRTVTKAVTVKSGGTHNVFHDFQE